MKMSLNSRVYKYMLAVETRVLLSVLQTGFHSHKEKG